MQPTPRTRAAPGTAALCLVAGGLVALTGLSGQTTAWFVLQHRDPTVHTLWTTHYVHANHTHATTNALGLLVVALPGLAVAHRHEQVQQYWTAVVGVGVVSPLPLSVTTLLWYRHLSDVRVSSSLGASGLVGGVAGVTLVVATLALWRSRKPFVFAPTAGLAVGVVCGAADIAAVSVAAVAVVVAVVVVGLRVTERLPADRLAETVSLRRTGRLVAHTAPLPVAVAALATVGCALAPAVDTPVVSGGVAHGVGFSLGVAWTAVVVAVLPRLETRRDDAPTTSATEQEASSAAGVVRLPVPTGSRRGDWLRQRRTTQWPSHHDTGWSWWRRPRVSVGCVHTGASQHRPECALPPSMATKTPIISSNSADTAYLRTPVTGVTVEHLRVLARTNDDPRHTPRTDRRYNRPAPQHGAWSGRYRNANRLHRDGARRRHRGWGAYQHGGLPAVEVPTDR